MREIRWIEKNVLWSSDPFIAMLGASAPIEPGLMETAHSVILAMFLIFCSSSDTICDGCGSSGVMQREEF